MVKQQKIDLEINWSTVKIITNSNADKTKDIISQFGKPYNQIGVANEGTILGRVFACTSSINTASNERLKNCKEMRDKL